MTGDGPNVRVRVEAEPWADGIAVWIIRDAGTVRIIERPNLDNIVIPGNGGNVTPERSMRLDDTAALALLDALAAHYRRATDTGTLRLDYEAERRRVDKLTDALIGAHAKGIEAERERMRLLTQREVGDQVKLGQFKPGQVLTADDMNRLDRRPR